MYGKWIKAYFHFYDVVMHHDGDLLNGYLYRQVALNSRGLIFCVLINDFIYIYINTELKYRNLIRDWLAINLYEYLRLSPTVYRQG